MNASPWLNIVKGLTAAAGLFMAVMGGLGVVLFLLQLLLSPGEITTDSVVVSAAAVVLGLGLGGALAWQGFHALGGRASQLFKLPPVALLGLLYILAVVIGQLLISFDFFPAVTFPLFHVAAATLPALIILAFAGRALTAVSLSRREIILQLSGGAFLATSVAFLAEIVFGLLILFTVFLITALTPGGLAFIETFTANLQDPAWVENPANLQEIILAPPILVTLVLVFVVLAPLVEEPAKLLGVALMSYRRPSRAQIFVWGLAGGAGFALVENLFNTVLALDVWAMVMLLRVGGTAMHSLGTGLMALGWHNLRVTRRPWKLLGALGISFTIHALWNGAVIGMAGTSVLLVDNPGEATLTTVGLVVLLMLGLLVILTVGLFITLALLTRRLRAD